jgi:hypothetical protein
MAPNKLRVPSTESLKRPPTGPFVGYFALGSRTAGSVPLAGVERPLVGGVLVVSITCVMCVAAKQWSCKN